MNRTPKFAEYWRGGWRGWERSADFIFSGGIGERGKGEVVRGICGGGGKVRGGEGKEGEGDEGRVGGEKEEGGKMNPSI